MKKQIMIVALGCSVSVVAGFVAGRVTRPHYVSYGGGLLMNETTGKVCDAKLQKNNPVDKGFAEYPACN